MCTFIAHPKSGQRLCSDFFNFCKIDFKTLEIMAQKLPRDFLVIFQSGQKIPKVDRNPPTADEIFGGGVKKRQTKNGGWPQRFPPNYNPIQISV